MPVATTNLAEELLRQIQEDQVFRPQEPESIEQTGLTAPFVEALLLKQLGLIGALSGRDLARRVCLPFNIVVPLLEKMRTQRLLAHAGPAALNDYCYVLTDSGMDRAETHRRQCGYVGPAPVPMSEYLVSVDAQSIADEAPDREKLAEACRGISIEPKLFAALGPALNSCSGLFLYGPPGNGKSTLARRLTMCFGQSIWIPHALVEDGEIIKLYDSQFHRRLEETTEHDLLSKTVDSRWVKVVRPTVVVGGELTLENLELRYNPESRVSEAPLQLKSNCGCLLLDDFGRQRIAPADLLNRWIVPLESKVDFLTLPSGKKLQVPFQQLIIFSTNLPPEALVDEAFLRRIPYKIQMTDPSEEEFYYLFDLYCQHFGCEYRKDVVTYLLDTHYRKVGRARRRCHARDLLTQVRSYCQYHRVKFELRPEYLDQAVRTYFAMVLKTAATE